MPAAVVPLADSYPAAHLDAVLVNQLAGKPREPFWQYAYTTLIRRLRLAAELLGEPVPDLVRLAEIVDVPVMLADFVERAVVAGEAAGGSERPREARHLRIWHESEWLELHPRLRRSLAEGLSVAAASPLALVGPGGDRVPFGRRRSSWSRWTVDAVAPEAARALECAKLEVGLPPA